MGLILIVGAVLRFWKIEAWQYFTYDQARDYLIVKSIIIDHKFTLVGPTVLAPGVYLPPFYYYSLVPFLWLFRFHIVGADIYTALFGVGAIVVFYFFARDLFGRIPSLFTTLIFSLNPVLINISRHAWNPNTIYFFTLIFAFGIYRYLEKRNSIYLFLSSFALFWAFNLHYTIVVFIPIFLFIWIKALLEKKSAKWFFPSIIICFVLISPIILFELRHSFLNTKSIIAFGQIREEIPVLVRMQDMAVDVIKTSVVLFFGLNKTNSFEPFNKIDLFNIFGSFSLFPLILIVLFLIVSISNLKLILKTKKRKAVCFLGAVLFLGFSIRLVFPPSSFYFYHYTFLFPFIFLIFIPPIFVNWQHKNIYNQVVGIIVVLLFFAFSIISLDFKSEKRTEEYFVSAAEVIFQNYSEGKKVVIAANLEDSNRWEHNALEYRYFAELFYRLPLLGWEETDYKGADVLYLVDEGDLKEPLKLGGMEMEAFGGRKIVGEWRAETGQRIYKITK